jgi:hypothetical protein
LFFGDDALGCSWTALISAASAFFFFHRLHAITPITAISAKTKTTKTTVMIIAVFVSLLDDDELGGDDVI